MIKHFYSYHLEIDSIIIEIDALPIRDHEKKHLKELAESQIHHAVLDAILAELKEDDRKLFLKYLNSKNQEKTWGFLRDRIRDVEEIIGEAANEIKKELYKDLKGLKSNEAEVK